MARPRVHLAISLGLAALQYRRTGRLLPAVAPLVSGFLVDADHLIDHQLYRRFPGAARDRLLLALHGWEFLLALAWWEPRALRGKTDRGLTLGMLAHLLVDQLTNEVGSPLTYLVLYRASRGFRGRFFREKPGRHSWRDTPTSQIWKWL